MASDATRSGLKTLGAPIPRVEATLGFGSQPLRGMFFDIYNRHLPITNQQ
jgi:hypothetical protein